jgi:hypothetical protein
LQFFETINNSITYDDVDALKSVTKDVKLEPCGSLFSFASSAGAYLVFHVSLKKLGGESIESSLKSKNESVRK